MSQHSHLLSYMNTISVLINLYWLFKKTFGSLIYIAFIFIFFHFFISLF